MITAELKPCGFCGSTRVARFINVTLFIQCKDCGASGPAISYIDDHVPNADDWAKAIEAWNTRASPTPDTPLEGEVTAETLKQMNEIAQELGYPSILEALEALQPTLPVPQGEVERLRLAKQMRRYGQSYSGIHRDIADDFFKAAEIIEASLTSSNRPTVDSLEALAEARAIVRDAVDEYPNAEALLAKIDGILGQEVGRGE